LFKTAYHGKNAARPEKNHSTASVVFSAGERRLQVVGG